MGQGRSKFEFPQKPGDSTFVVDDDPEGDEITTPPAPFTQHVDDILDRDADNSRVERGRARSSLWFLFFLLLVFAILVVSTGIRCATDFPQTVTGFNGTLIMINASASCSMHAIPTLGTMINSESTGPLAVTALNVLGAIHILLTINTFILVSGSSPVVAVTMVLSSFLLYVMFYVALFSPHWYMALTPLVCMGLWCSLATYGLYRYYRKQPRRKLFFTSLVCLFFYVVPTILYIAFSAVTYGDVPQKDIAVLVCELLMLISCCGFVLILAVHTKRVSYLTEVRRGYEMT